MTNLHVLYVYWVSIRLGKSTWKQGSRQGKSTIRQLCIYDDYFSVIEDRNNSWTALNVNVNHNIIGRVFVWNLFVYFHLCQKSNHTFCNIVFSFQGWNIPKTQTNKHYTSNRGDSHFEAPYPSCRTMVFILVP